MVHHVVRLLMVSGLVLLVVALWRKDVLPEPHTVRAELSEEPQQLAVTRAAFDATVNNITYRIQPLYRYELYGVVVSRHDSDSVADLLHRQWNDSLNVVDLCVIWGNNLRTGAYRDINFSSSPSWCFFETRSSEAYAAFDATALSNNHLLTPDPQIVRKLRQARVGDQIHFRGYLAEYSHNHGMAFKRGTSTVRNDTGDGACETVYVEDFEILRAGGGPWRALVWVGAGLLLLGIVGWVRAPVRFNH
jgi:hypothetical protein